ncbi:hypothetical protein ACFOSC_19605 [Streptantibioticus rubrisoli]|uniref:Uncharacterized protein n=1 Tax=Streptantibioticus rubrisoli TaxID=1387313 RepID=A0ABT1PK73_9ACTN|nr:hypothetical protein [Streptantibioticus rubrisoli]MCQ4045767.1 hypothetical protein [Streptantibioticus rubrisoli]
MLTRPSDTYVSLALLASLSVFTWAILDPAAEPVGMVLVAHAPVRSAEETGRSVERRMRDFASALGMREDGVQAPCLRPRLTIDSLRRVVLRADGMRYGLQLPTSPGWKRLVGQRARATVIVGLDPLQRASEMPDIERYLDRAVAERRLYFGAAQVIRSNVISEDLGDPRV